MPDAKRLKDLEAENARLKKLFAEQIVERDVIKDIPKGPLTASAKRALVRQMIERGLSERRALRVG